MNSSFPCPLPSQPTVSQSKPETTLSAGRRATLHASEIKGFGARWFIHSIFKRKRTTAYAPSRGQHCDTSVGRRGSSAMSGEGGRGGNKAGRINERERYA
eukprot:3684519-Rhodomonas_salina.2